jgi:hypothetical protein
MTLGEHDRNILKEIRELLVELLRCNKQALEYIVRKNNRNARSSIKLLHEQLNILEEMEDRD